MALARAGCYYCYFATATYSCSCYCYCCIAPPLRYLSTGCVLSCNPIAHSSVLCFLPPPFYPPSIPGFSRHLESARSLGKSNIAVRGPFPSQAPQGKSVAMKTMLKSRSCANPFFPSPIPMTRPSPEPLPFLSPLSPPQCVPNPQRRFQFLVAPEPNANLPAPPLVITATCQNRALERGNASLPSCRSRLIRSYRLLPVSALLILSPDHICRRRR